MPIDRYEDHSDTVTDKISLLTRAYKERRFDVAMALAESIKDTLRFERQAQPAETAAQIPADQYLPVKQLPPPLAQWARGWSFCKPVTLFETVGIARAGEPVELDVAFSVEQLTDVSRELRVARWDASERRLREIPSQVDGLRRQEGELRCRLAFAVDVAAHESAHYLIFYGNPNAELPEYTTDLRVDGEGYGLDITNRHYVAHLSHQHGQLERLTLRREHGLELYAGGKGHGEPPAIDWGHDYVDGGAFQKLRLRNGAQPPNYEIVRGPICVQVRRWGFPYSPVHPLFTPSRMHIDISYTFYAGVPYFLKRGRMEMVQDISIEAMRDDEWVFSGYSFTDLVWIDSAGRLHEGLVPTAQTNDLWGVGFYNRTSRDAFVALRLEHTARGFDHLPHGGAPTLHYAGHGQLWSRYPSGKASFKAGSWVQQKNAYIVGPYPDDAAVQIPQLRHQLLHPLEVHIEPGVRFDGATTGPRLLARAGETSETAPLKPAIWRTLREVRDEQFYTADANIVDMGYVYDVRERDGIVHVVLTMPNRGRPVYDFLATQGGGRVEPGIRERLLKLGGVRDVVVHFTWEPAWSSARLTDAGRKTMMLG